MNPCRSILQQVSVVCVAVLLVVMTLTASAARCSAGNDHPAEAERAARQRTHTGKRVRQAAPSTRRHR